jgi:hypothetical protein
VLAAVLMLSVAIGGSLRAEESHVTAAFAMSVMSTGKTGTTFDWRAETRRLVPPERLALQRRLFARLVAAQEAREASRFVSHHEAIVPGLNLDYTSWPDWPLWRCTMLHESAGSWTFQSRHNAGAFGINRATWRAYGGAYARDYPNAALAAPVVQILGARLVRARVGSTLWGGLRACGG